MQTLAAASKRVRHGAAALAEAALIVAIAAAFAFGVGFFGGSPAGAAGVDAAQKTKVTMAAAPTSVAVGEVLHLTGSGLDPARQAWVRTETSTAVGWWSLGVAANGTYGIDLTFPQSGTAKIAVYQVVNNRTVLMSSCTVSVQ